MCAIVPAIATGLGLFQGLAMRNAAKQQAEQTAQTEYANIRSQEDAKNLKVTTAGQNLKDKEAAKARKSQAASLVTRQKVGSLQASGIAGNLLATLTGEQQREGANIQNNLNISRNTLRRNLGLEVRGYEAEASGRRNQSISNVNQAYAQVPSMTQTLLGVGSQALTYDWSS